MAPNTIDFNAVFDDLDEKLVENAAVVGTVVVVIILYISLLVLCRKLDQRDKIKVIGRAFLRGPHRLQNFQIDHIHKFK